MNYYNEFDHKAAAWLQQLINDHQIPYGYVDSRSILEVQPSDLSGFTQCHFFAGVGGWSLALRLAGWPADRPVWTASLPCQPFSTAGKQNGTGDERHLWPTFECLVSECRPPTIFGEQVASKLARTDWLPGVCMDLQALGYAATAADLCAPCAGEIGEGRIVRGDQESWERVIIGAPHIRQRLYWVANADSERRSGIGLLLRTKETWTDGAGHIPEVTGSGEAGTIDGLANDECDRREVPMQQCGYVRSETREWQTDESGGDKFHLLPCRDGKTRRTQSGIFPLVNGIPRGVVPSGDPSDPSDPSYANATPEARAVRLKGYGNAIVPPLAAMFIKTCMEVTNV